MTDYYVYAYLDPRKPGRYTYRDFVFDYEPIYIGKGTRTRAYHFSDRAGSLKNKFTKFGKPIVVFIAKGLTEEAAYNLEMRWIKKIGRIDQNKGTLCNLTDGGEGGLHVSEETRKKQSLAKKGKPNGRKGCHLSEEHKQKLSKKLKGRIISEETRKKMSLGRMGDKHHHCMLGRHHTKEAIEKMVNNARKTRSAKGYVDPRIGRKWSEKRKNKWSEQIKQSWKNGNLRNKWRERHAGGNEVS